MSTSGPSFGELLKLMQRLPQEIHNSIYDHVFDLEGVDSELGITGEYCTPQILQVDSASRKALNPLYYLNRTFHAMEVRLISDFICRLAADSVSQLDAVRLDFIDKDSQRISRMRHVIDPQGQAAQRQRDEARVRVWEVIDELQHRRCPNFLLRSRGWSFLVAQAWTEKDGVLEVGQLHRFGDMDDLLEMKRRS